MSKSAKLTCPGLVNTCQMVLNLSRLARSKSPGLVSTCQMVQNRPRSCFEGFRRFPEAWKTLLSRRRSSWQSFGQSHVQFLIRPRRWISQLPGTSARRHVGRISKLPGTSARRHVGRASPPARRVSPGRYPLHRETEQAKRGGGRARQRNWIRVAMWALV